MRVTILGSGTAVPVRGRFPSGALVQSGDTNVMVDIGPGVLRRLAEIEVGLEQVHAVLLTHFHTDHTADLPALLFGLRNPRYAGRGPLRVLAAEGLDEFLQHLTRAWPWLKPVDYELRVEQVEPQKRFDLGALKVTGVPIRHTSASLAYRIEDSDGAVVAFSGDADECDGLVEVSRNADLFVCDSAFPDAHRTAGHLTPSLAGRAAEAAGVRKLCLTHFYPECEGHDLLGEARGTFNGEVVLAQDLLEFSVRPRS